MNSHHFYHGTVSLAPTPRHALKKCPPQATCFERACVSAPLARKKEEKSTQASTSNDTRMKDRADVKIRKKYVC